MEKLCTDKLIDVDNFLSPNLFGFRSTEQCLINMLATWKRAIDETNIAGGILTDLSKAFGYLKHNLFLAKLHAYGFDNFSLNFIGSILIAHGTS